MHCCNTDSEIQHADHGQTHLRFAWAGLPSCRASSLCSLLKLLYFRHLKMNVTLTDHTSIILLRNGLLRNTLDIINITKNVPFREVQQIPVFLQDFKVLLPRIQVNDVIPTTNSIKIRTRIT